MQNTGSQFPVRHQLAGLVVCMIVTFSAAAIGSFASARAGAFYAALVRPDWAPPGWLFAPVWTLLYVLMAIAVWLVWRRHGFRRARDAIVLYALQLAANAIWTWLFFTWRQGALAFVEILILWALLLATIVAFRRLHRLASLLLIPYLAWVSFAAVLTYATWDLNPGILG